MGRGRGSSKTRIALGLGAIVATTACTEKRDVSQPAATFATDVAPILKARCDSCHAGDAPAGGWRSTSFLDAIGCVASSGAPATLPAAATAPILQALDTPTHQTLVDATERAKLESWVAAGAPAFQGTVHDPGIIDPRSSGWHGKLLRDRAWKPMLDAAADDACGKCHEGVPAQPAGFTSPAPGAPACTTCHTEPKGVLACGTCHGQGSRAYPPRDLCFFPDDARAAGAHAAHIESPLSVAAGLGCATCHPVPGDDLFSGSHANGAVEITFEQDKIGPERSYDRPSGVCALSCHDRSGDHPRPKWSDTGLVGGCGHCHASPPPAHFAGACTYCHHEANADGTMLDAHATFHLNGQVDLGDGSGKCGACHGKGDDPFPSTGAHAAHQNPTLTTAVACGDCHVVPAQLMAPGHMDGTVEVVLSGRAIARGAAPRWNGQTCSGVACHGAMLPDLPAVVPTWTDTTGAPAACGACHGIPPSHHSSSLSCNRVECHGAEVRRTLTTISISDMGKALHINGVVDAAGL
jgi:predicted CxxxxCH...CXXCH cytochrome family protein